MRFRTFFSAAALALSCTFVAGGALADVDAAKAFVKDKHSSIKELVEKGSPSDKVKEAMGGMVDYDQLAMRTMGSPCPLAVPQCTNHWKDLSADQKKEVTDLPLTYANFRD